MTDCHLQVRPGATLLGVDTADSLAAVLDQAVCERRPDAVLATGDLAHEPEPDTYRRFHDLVRERLDVPWLCLPGNHDLTAPFARVLGDVRTLRLGDWEIVGFDSHADHRTQATLGDAERRELLERVRSSEASHLLVACHHHLEPVGCPWLDKDCIPGGRDLLESCTAAAAAGAGTEPRLRRLRGLAFGHVHQEVHTHMTGISVLGTPSTCFQFEPFSPRFTIDRAPATAQPGYRWLFLHDDGTLSSEVRRASGFAMTVDLPAGA